MSLPRVLISYTNGNLLADIAVIDGIAGLIGPAWKPANVGKPMQVFSLKDAESKGFSVADEPMLWRHIMEFYKEVGGNQELWIMGAATNALQSAMLDSSDPAGALKLIKAANGKIRLLGVTTDAAAVGTDFLSTDVEAAVIAAKTFCEARLAELRPLRVLIEGKISNEASNVIFSPKTASNGFAGVVLGGSQADVSASVGTALGRAVKYPAHIKLGKVANGPLSLNKVYIGSRKLADVTNLEALHDLGFISFMQHPNKAGFYFGIDRMASTDDFRLLAYGRIIDKAAIIAAGVYVEELEGEVDVDRNTGKIREIDIEHLKSIMTQQINRLMGDQISGVEVFIDPAQDIINTGILKVKVKVTPKGYTSQIEVDLGLNAPAIG